MTDTIGPCDYAYPVAPGDVAYWQPGMTLRDYFAGQALSSEAMFRAYHKTPDVMAEYAYEVADAMLKARAKRGEG